MKLLLLFGFAIGRHSQLQSIHELAEAACSTYLWTIRLTLDSSIIMNAAEVAFAWWCSTCGETAKFDMISSGTKDTKYVFFACVCRCVRVNGRIILPFKYKQHTTIVTYKHMYNAWYDLWSQVIDSKHTPRLSIIFARLRRFVKKDRMWNCVQGCSMPASSGLVSRASP